jgi:hypothetical protein
MPSASARRGPASCARPRTVRQRAWPARACASSKGWPNIVSPDTIGDVSSDAFGSGVNGLEIDSGVDVAASTRAAFGVAALEALGDADRHAVPGSPSTFAVSRGRGALRTVIEEPTSSRRTGNLPVWHSDALRRRRGRRGGLLCHDRRCGVCENSDGRWPTTERRGSPVRMEPQLVVGRTCGR